MSLRKRSAIVLLVIFHFMILAFTLQGCKEGTQNSPISALLNIDDVTKPTVNLADLGSDVAKYTISGVIVSKNSNEKLANISVSLFYEGKLAGNTKTTSEGKYFFTKLPTGLYDLTIAADDAVYASAAYVIRVLDDGSMSPPAPETQLSPKITGGPVLVKISGVVLSTTNDKLDNVDVELWQGTTLKTSTVTSGEGKFFFDNLGANSYRLVVANGSPVYVTKNFNVTVLPDGSISPTSPTIVLTERTSESFTIAGVVKTQSNEVLSNLQIDLRKDSSAAAIVDTTYTTGEGKFFFQNLSSGMYYLKVSAGSSTLASDFYPVRILSDGTISPAFAEVLVAQKDTLVAYPVNGTIYDAFSGGPLEYATVKISQLGNNLTDGSGKFSFPSLVPGIYQLEVAKYGFETLVTSFNLKADGTTSPSTIALMMIHSQKTGYGSISGRIVDETTNEGVPNLIVRVYAYELVKKEGLARSESGWEVSGGLILTTRTLDANPAESQDQKGSFKLTHLAPTNDNFRYAIYFGTGDSKPSFINEPLDNSLYLWKFFDRNAAGYYTSVRNLSVQDGKTTFYTNYEHEK